MDILSDFRISALIATERELAERAERVRVALERSDAPRYDTTATGSLIAIPAGSYGI